MLTEHVELLVVAGVEAYRWSPTPGFRYNWFENTVPTLSGRDPVPGGRKVIFVRGHFMTFLTRPELNPYPGWSVPPTLWTISRGGVDLLSRAIPNLNRPPPVPNQIDAEMFWPKAKVSSIAWMSRKRPSVSALLKQILRNDPRSEGVEPRDSRDRTHAQVAEVLAGTSVFIALAVRRRAAGYPAVSLAWGAWEPTGGMTARLGETDSARLARGAPVAEALRMLDTALHAPRADLVPAVLDRKALRALGSELPALLRDLVGEAAPAWRGLDLTGLNEPERRVRLLDLVHTEAAAVIRHALADAGLRPSEVEAVEAHGTGLVTLLGDVAPDAHQPGPGLGHGDRGRRGPRARPGPHRQPGRGAAPVRGRAPGTHPHGRGGLLSPAARSAPW